MNVEFYIAVRTEDSLELFEGIKTMFLDCVPRKGEDVNFTVSKSYFSSSVNYVDWCLYADSFYSSHAHVVLNDYICNKYNFKTLVETLKKFGWEDA